MLNVVVVSVRVGDGIHVATIVNCKQILDRCSLFFEREVLEPARAKSITLINLELLSIPRR